MNSKDLKIHYNQSILLKNEKEKLFLFFFFSFLIIIPLRLHFNQLPISNPIYFLFKDIPANSK
jgi:hypothetical protein